MCTCSCVHARTYTKTCILEYTTQHGATPLKKVCARHRRPPQTCRAPTTPCDRATAPFIGLRTVDDSDIVMGMVTTTA